ncbi:TldD/PmbA family protein [Desulfitibacter alkalitolerans]|uniref:TldD/PmbA family protein n=1 Tax=Desulfitibacter alkalitolerans TaxID=264641 RepID=UPI000486BA1E|nr:TldD/PmbA family protein [Desulfitibacter alkalitolerans]
MIKKTDLQEILAVAKKYGGDFAEIFIEKKNSSGVGLEAGKIERVVSGVDIGAGIRVITGENTSYAYTNDLSIEALMNAARIVAKSAGNDENPVSIDLSKEYKQRNVHVEKEPDTIPIDKKVEKVVEANRVAREVDDRIKQVMVGYGDVVQEVVIANSLGELVEDKRIRTRFVVNSVAAEGSLIQTGYEAVGSFAGFELFDEMDSMDIAKKAARRAVKMLEARPAPSGRMPVVMTSQSGGTMVHEACGHGLEADLAQKKLSVYAGKKGEQVAAPEVTVIDDGTMKKYGYLTWDDEGVKSRRNTLIKKGVLEEFMYDRLTAMKEKRESTGNGRRESYQNRPIPRMTNTYIDRGSVDPEKIIKETKKGLLVEKMGGGQVNTTNGDFVFDVAEGYLIENGEVKEAVRGATLTGNGPKVLSKIDMVGNDLGFAIGTCGKDGQGVPVSDAQPTLRVTELVVGGTEAPGTGPEIRRIRRL